MRCTEVARPNNHKRTQHIEVANTLRALIIVIRSTWRARSSLPEARAVLRYYLKILLSLLDRIDVILLRFASLGQCNTSYLDSFNSPSYHWQFSSSTIIRIGTFSSKARAKNRSMASPTSTMKTLESLATLLHKLPSSDTALIYALMEQGFKRLVSQPPLGILGDQVSMLKGLASLQAQLIQQSGGNQEIEKLIAIYFIEIGRTLSEDLQETLKEQLFVLQELLSIRQYIDFNNPRRVQLDVYISGRILEVNRLLARDICGTMEEQVSVLKNLLDLDAQLQQGPWAINVIGFQMRRRIEHMRSISTVTTEEVEKQATISRNFS